jgi:hypothetical protein
MGPLVTITTPSTQGGEPAALGIGIAGSELTYGWSRHPGGAVELPKGVPWANLRADWRELGYHVASDDALFEWLFTWNWVRDQLQQILKDACLRPPTEALQAEYDWHLALLASRSDSNGILCEPVPLRALRKLVDAGEGFEYVSRGTRRVSVRQLHDVVARHHARGLESVANPWPCSDRNTGWIPSAWTPERRLERLQKVSEAALAAYDVVVQRYLPSFNEELGTYRLMPVKLLGYMHEDLELGRPFGRYNDKWCLEPVPEGRPNGVKWVQVETTPSSDELAAAVRASFAAYRPGLPVRGVISGGLVGLESARPAMNLLATLLWRDFRDWEWVSGAGPDLSNSNHERDPIPDLMYWAQPSFMDVE